MVILSGSNPCRAATDSVKCNTDMCRRMCVCVISCAKYVYTEWETGCEPGRVSSQAIKWSEGTLLQVGHLGSLACPLSWHKSTIVPCGAGREYSHGLAITKCFTTERLSSRWGNSEWWEETDEVAQLDRNVGVEYRELTLWRITRRPRGRIVAQWLATGTAVEERLVSEVLLEPFPCALKCSFPS